MTHHLTVKDFACIMLMIQRRYMYSQDVNFFEKIDTEAKAYFLGYMLADGYIEDRFTYFRSRIILAAEDKHILDEFNKRLRSDKPLVLRKGGNRPTKNGKIMHCQDCYVLTLNDKASRDLMRHGLTPNKSLTADLHYSMIPKNLIRHVVRGIFDGDGCFINRQRGNTYEMNIAVSEASGNSIIKILKENLGMDAILRNDRRIFKLCLNNYYDMNRFFEWLYNDSDSSLRLTRKYDIYLRFKSDKDGLMKKKEELLPFKEAKKRVAGLVATKKEWIELCKMGGKPGGVPANPRAVYIKTGEWDGFEDFLGQI